MLGFFEMQELSLQIPELYLEVVIHISSQLLSVHDVLHELNDDGVVQLCLHLHVCQVKRLSDQFEALLKGQLGGLLLH